jgi:hypothetical protein
MAQGYIYCLSNPLTPGVLKCGMTLRTPEERLKEANSCTWSSPTWKIEIAKKVLNPRAKELTLHKLLEQYTERIHSRREFFRISVEEIKTFFDLIDGEIWGTSNESEMKEEEDEEDSISTEESTQPSESKKKGCRDMTKCFQDGQKIRHIIGINKEWIGTYDAKRNGIVCNGKFYTSLSNFALLHNRVYNPTRMSTDGWTHCECEIDGKWVSTYSLPG